eukprot:659208-Prymnesium_polylepis.2
MSDVGCCVLGTHPVDCTGSKLARLERGQRATARATRPRPRTTLGRRAALGTGWQAALALRRRCECVNSSLAKDAAQKTADGVGKREAGPHGREARSRRAEPFRATKFTIRITILTQTALDM